MIRALAGAVLLTALSLAAGTPPAAAVEPIHRPADRATLEELAVEAGVRTAPAQAGLLDYLGHVIRSLAERLFRWGAEVIPGRALASATVWTAIALLAVALLAIMVRLAGWVLGRSPGRLRRAAATPFETAEVGRDLVRLAEAERRRVDALLAAGRVHEALEAIWWWAATSLAGPDADPSWTSHELLERTGRRDLRRSLAHLDRYTYGSREPRAAEVRDLVGHLEGALA